MSTGPLEFLAISLIAALFLFSQVGMNLPYLRDSFENWLTYRHSDPSWFFAFLMFAIGTFVIWPFSVWLGAFCGGKRPIRATACQLE